MTTTILTDEQIVGVWGSTAEPCVVKQGNEYLIHKFARSIEQAVLQSPEVQAWKCDAELYRALRQMHWNSSPLCVVENPKTSVKHGSDCPSGERLDVAIRAAMEKQP